MNALVERPTLFNRGKMNMRQGRSELNDRRLEILDWPALSEESRKD